MLRKILPLLFIAALSSCATSPTGRTQFTMMPAAQMDAMGVQSFEQMKQQTPINKDETTNRYVRCVASAITGITGGDWEVVVFEEPSANAFALPGGKIGVHTGLLEVAQNQHQLAAVMAHEVSHVLAQHGNERVSQQFAVSQGMAIVESLARGESNESNDMAMALMGLGAQVGILLPFSRVQESEADIYGLELMAKAGFDPNESVQLWVNMGKAGGGGAPEFLSTHPSHSTRIDDLKKAIPKVIKHYDAARSRGRQPQCRL